MTYDASEERYRIYRQRGTEGPALLATCATPEALGVALTTLHGEDEFEGYRVGLMDRPDPEQNGSWLVNPYGAVHSRSRELTPLGDTAAAVPADT